MLCLLDAVGFAALRFMRCRHGVRALFPAPFRGLVLGSSWMPSEPTHAIRGMEGNPVLQMEEFRCVRARSRFVLDQARKRHLPGIPDVDACLITSVL